MYSDHFDLIIFGQIDSLAMSIKSPLKCMRFNQGSIEDEIKALNHIG